VSPATRTIPLAQPLDLEASLRTLRLGASDPTMLLTEVDLLRATRTPVGTATLRAELRAGEVVVTAWGDGAEWALEMAPSTLGLLDDARDFDPAHPLVRDIHRRSPGLRMPRTGRLFEALVPAVLSQRITGFEAKRSFRQLVERWGEPAPGPGGLHLVPLPEESAQLGYYDLHVIGIEKKRADVLKRVAAHATRLEGAVAEGPTVLAERLGAIPGIGRWTLAEVQRVVLGDADAVSVGDYHLKHLVTFLLAGEPRGTDDRMLELLEPFAGHRGRVCLLLEHAGRAAPRYGPRARIQPIAGR
jgi:3-methyladenine DNA glycosylase/8-oxoguanine DNA glycosylase